MRPLINVLKDCVVDIDNASQGKQNNDGISTGFRKIDDMTGGLRRGSLVVVGGRPAMGKMAFLQSLAINMTTKDKYSVDIYTNGLPEKVVGKRFISMVSQVESKKLAHGNLERSDWNDINIALGILQNARLRIDDSFFKSDGMPRFKDGEADVIIIGGWEQNLTAKTIDALKRKAKEDDCVIILSVPTGLASEEREDHRPVFSDLKCAEAIDDYADVVMLLYREAYYNPEIAFDGDCEVHVVKNNGGHTGTALISWVRKFIKFIDIYRELELFDD